MINRFSLIRCTAAKWLRVSLWMCSGEQRRDKWNLKGWYEIDDMDIPALMAFTGMTGGENDISRVLKDGLVDSRGFIEKSGDRESVRVDSFSLDGLDYRFAFSGFGNREEIILSDISFTSSQHQLRGSLQGKMSDIAIISTRLVHNGNSLRFISRMGQGKGNCRCKREPWPERPLYVFR